MGSPHSVRGLDIAEIQRRLSLSGYFTLTTNEVDEPTRASLRRYQFAHGLPVTGEPDAATVAALRRSSSSATMPAVRPEELRGALVLLDVDVDGNHLVVREAPPDAVTVVYSRREDGAHHRELLQGDEREHLLDRLGEIVAVPSWPPLERHTMSTDTDKDTASIGSGPHDPDPPPPPPTAVLLASVAKEGAKHAFLVLENAGIGIPTSLRERILRDLEAGPWPR